MRLLMVPEDDGRVGLAFFVGDIVVPDPGPQDALRLVFVREDPAATPKTATFRMPPPRRIREQPPLARLLITFGPRGVQLVTQDLRSSAMLLVKLPGNQDFWFTTTGFAAAWDALKACDPAHGARLP